MSGGARRGTQASEGSVASDLHAPPGEADASTFSPPMGIQYPLLSLHLLTFNGAENNLSILSWDCGDTPWVS